MDDLTILQNRVFEQLAQIYKECGNDYIKYVNRIEEMERNGEIKTEYIPRDNVNTIWKRSETK